jgi:hypothetical protein
MKSTPSAAALLFCLLSSYSFAVASASVSGFFLPDSLDAMTISYRTVDGLIVLPVRINDSIEVNLLLDTGCRNLILFGKKFKNQLDFRGSRPVIFSGLGNGSPVKGELSLGNKVSIGHVIGRQIPIVVVQNSNLFGKLHKIDGVVGYDIFLRFEVELNPRHRTVTFRPADKVTAPPGFTMVPLRIVDARPVIESNVFLWKDSPRKLELMVDTGSSLGLLLKTTNIDQFQGRTEKVLGEGLNGPVSGFSFRSPKLQIHGFEIKDVKTGIVSSQWHDNASIGMEVLQDYVVILNYCKQYAGFRRFT